MVVALPGSYSHHAGSMIRALEAEPGCRVRVVQLDKPEFLGMSLGMSVRMRLETDHSTAELIDPETAALLRDSDVVIADWADKGAVWASLLVPRDVRLVIRIHSVDVLSGPIHLVDWSAVDAVIAVSPHIRDVFRAVLGERVEHLDVPVVTNRILTETFDTQKSQSAEWTLGLVGWGQHVKDPVLALEVLARLRQRDERWRLKLIGADFAHKHAEHLNPYGREFMRRALQPDIVDAIEYAGFTRRLPTHLRDIGYILSTSLRESCPVGVLEGVASGAVPVVREWPVFARLKAAHRLFPDRFVFSTAVEAADIIETNRDGRSERAAEAREEMADLFSVAKTEGRLVETILGRG
jgi:glycosyltransferase involved in cell wall biosynthesis